VDQFQKKPHSCPAQTLSFHEFETKLLEHEHTGPEQQQQVNLMQRPQRYDTRDYSMHVEREGEQQQQLVSIDAQQDKVSKLKKEYDKSKTTYNWHLLQQAISDLEISKHLESTSSHTSGTNGISASNIAGAIQGGLQGSNLLPQQGGQMGGQSNPGYPYYRPPQSGTTTTTPSYGNYPQQRSTGGSTSSTYYPSTSGGTNYPSSTYPSSTYPSSYPSTSTTYPSSQRYPPVPTYSNYATGTAQEPESLENHSTGLRRSKRNQNQSKNVKS